MTRLSSRASNARSPRPGRDPPATSRRRCRSSTRRSRGSSHARDVDRSALAVCLTARSSIASISHDTHRQLADAKAALALLDRPRPGQFQIVLDAHMALARAQGALGDDASAAAEYQRAADELVRAGQGENQNEATALQSASTYLSRAGQWRRASETCERSLQLFERVAGSKNILPSAQTNCAKLLVELGRYDEAKALVAHATQDAERLGHSRSVGPVAMISSTAWCASHDLDRCAQMLDVAHRNLTATLPAGHSLLGSLAMIEAQLALARSEPELARDRLRPRRTSSRRRPIATRTACAWRRCSRRSKRRSGILTNRSAWRPSRWRRRARRCRASRRAAGSAKR